MSAPITAPHPIVPDDTAARPITTTVVAAHTSGLITGPNPVLQLPVTLPKTFKLTAQTVMLITGMFAVALGTAGIMAAGLGVGPVDILYGALTTHTGIAHGTIAAGFAVIYTTIAVLVGARPNIGTFACAVGIGPILNFGIAHAPTTDNLWLAWVYATTSLLVMTVGLAAIIVSRTGRGSVELIIGGLAERSRLSETTVRYIFEGTLLVTGLALAGPFGPFTIAYTLIVGPLIAVLLRLLDNMAVTSAGKLTERRIQRHGRRISRL